MIIFRKLHKWLTLLIGVQLIIWLVSGTIISLVDHNEASGAVTRSTNDPTKLSSTAGSLFPLSELGLTKNAVRTVTLENILGHPTYRVIRDDTGVLFDAQNGQPIRVDKALAEEIAIDSYRGTGALISSERLELGSDEVRATPGPVWRIDFDDAMATRVYVSANDGQLLAHRNSRWKLVDFLLMLHFMDYFRADSFNNPQIIAVGFGTLWIALSGLLLIYYSFSRSDFLWLPGVRSRGRKVNSMIGTTTRNGQLLELDGSLSYYAGLSQHGVRLPSNCDGSASCGLCKVRYESDAPDHTAADREWIAEDGLADGIRLGCQHRPRADDVVVVPEMAFQKEAQRAVVVSSCWLTPLLKEIRLRPETPIRFVAGDYLEFPIPAYQVSLEQFSVPDTFSATWENLSLPEQWAHTASSNVSRTYSIAAAPDERAPQELMFTVRFSLPPSASEFLPGRGSSYMCSLKAGDRVAFRGPAGDFRLVDSDSEKILIGGGAGMAPLRSMALHLLENLRWQGSLRFWYGARNEQEILYRETLEALAAAHPNFEWAVALSDVSAEDPWPGHRGHIHEAIYTSLLKDYPTLRECEFYLCGPPPMLAATRAMLRELGVPDSQVRFDDFGN